MIFRMDRCRGSWVLAAWPVLGRREVVDWEEVGSESLVVLIISKSRRFMSIMWMVLMDEFIERFLSNSEVLEVVSKELLSYQCKIRAAILFSLCQR